RMETKALDRPGKKGPTPPGNAAICALEDDTAHHSMQRCGCRGVDGEDIDGCRGQACGPPRDPAVRALVHAAGAPYVKSRRDLGVNRDRIDARSGMAGRSPCHP